MMAVADGIKPDNFARQVKPGNLLFASRQGGVGLDGPGADSVHSLKRLALMEKMVASLQGAATLNNAVELIQLTIFDCGRQANWIQCAFGAVGFAQGTDDDRQGRSVAVRHGGFVFRRPSGAPS